MAEEGGGVAGCEGEGGVEEGVVGPDPGAGVGGCVVEGLFVG